MYLAKRIDPSADWIARNSGDPGRGGLLYTEGLFQRMPAAIDPAVVAAEHEGDAWWVVLRTTLLHGDLRDEHIGFDDGTLIALDWGAATQGHPVLGLAWCMVHDVWRIEATHDEVVEDRLRGERDDPRQSISSGCSGS